jgi:hypothetical protein
VKGLRAPFWALLAALGLLGWWGSDRIRREAWTTNDEPVHVRACRELRSGQGVVSNFEHPVLMKVIGAAGLGESRGARPIDETRAARTFFPPLFGLLVVLAGLWTALKAGPWAGAAVAALLVAEPTLRAHSALVTSDLLIALLFVAAAFLLDLSEGESRRGRLLLAASGVVFGLAMAAKYSALPFLPVFAAVAFLLLLRRRAPKAVASRADQRRARKKPSPPSGPLPPRRAAGLVLLLVVVPALATAFLVQEGVMSSTPREELVRGIRRQFGNSEPLERAVWMGENLPRGIAGYGAGLLWVRASSVPGFRPNYFLGRVSGTGFIAYFPAALAVKLTTASAALLAAAAAAGIVLLATAIRAWRGGHRSGRAARRGRLTAARAFVPGALALAYLGAASLSNVNIGVRHVLPVVPLGLVAGAGVLVTLFSGRRRFLSALLGVAVLAAAGEAFAARGREVPFGNLLVGGPSGTRRVLGDSNVDWGEAQGKLFERARRGDLGRTAVIGLAFDAEEGGPLGLTWSESIDRPPCDTAAVSVFILDLGRALRSNAEGYPRIEWMKGWLVPLVDELERRATSVEPLSDEYLLYRIGPPAGAPGVPAR